MITALDHVQLAMPAGGEHAARGGAWFALPDGRQLHLRVEKPFRPSKRAQPAFVVADLDEMAERLEAGGSSVGWDEELAPRRRFYGEDLFGNRLEFLAEGVEVLRP